jgi:hypothetical protein
MLEHYSHIRMAAKRAALDAVASAPKFPVFQVDVHQVAEGEKVGLANTLN